MVVVGVIPVVVTRNEIHREDIGNKGRTNYYHFPSIIDKGFHVVLNIGIICRRGC